MFVGLRPVHTSVLEMPIELGRESDQDDGQIFSVIPGQGLSRMAIAEKSFTDMSRRLVLITPLGGDRVSVQNISRSNTILIESQQPLTPNQQRELLLPVSMSAFDRRINISRATASRTMMWSLDEPVLPSEPLSSNRSLGLASSFPLADQLVDEQSDRFIDWLRAVVSVLQSAISSIDFYKKATRELAELIGLDATYVLELDADGKWRIISDYERMPQSEKQRQNILASNVLDKILTEKRTFWEVPKPTAAAMQTLEESFASVAAPLMTRDGRVTGALYGNRKLFPGAIVQESISKLEAMLVETMAQGISAGRMRVEHERSAAAAQIRFEQFFTPELSQHLADSPDLLSFRDAEVTLLFCDIRKFSSISEALGPARTMEWMSEVMGRMADIAAEYQGALVDYIGDELMVMWGAPSVQPDHATRACRAALEMAAAMEELNKTWEPKIGRRTALGFGLNTGTAGVGNVGFERKFRYAPFGNVVNLASRVQGVTKYFGVDVIVTEATRRDSTFECVCRPLCRVRVVNIAEPVMLYQLCVDESEATKKLCAQYEAALDSFESKDLTSAIHTLSDLLRQHPTDGPSLMLLSRAVEQLLHHDQSFDPVMEMPGK